MMVGTDNTVSQSGDGLRVGLNGLGTNEANLIRQAIASANTSGQLGQLEILDGANESDVILVNGDDPESVLSWRQLSSEQPHLKAVLVVSGARRYPGQTVLRRPLKQDAIVHALNEAMSSAKEPASANEELAEQSLTVLVVDDSYPAREYISLKLDEIADDAMISMIDFAEDGEIALHMAADHAYDLIFLDVVMPGVDGYEVCRQIKQMYQCRVAMLTSRAAPVDFGKGREAGCDNYLAKPPHDTDLRSILRLTMLKKSLNAS